MREIDDLDELKRIGGSLLGVAPSSQQASARAHILFLRGGLGEGGGGRESRTKLEERSEFKLTREKRTRPHPRAPFFLRANAAWLSSPRASDAPAASRRIER